jgi:hypothetical protein
VTSPPERIQVLCPKCGTTHQDWYRASLSLTLDHFDDEYIRQASTATCPTCGTVVELGTLIVDEDGTWRIGG